MSNEKSNLWDSGQHPPAGRINPDYKERPTNPRTCVQCGEIHDSILEDRMTGERIKEFDKCSKCIINDVLTKVEWGGFAGCITSDGINVNMADELNRLENERLD